jgi:hypothetical protein
MCLDDRTSCFSHLLRFRVEHPARHLLELLLQLPYEYGVFALRPLGVGGFGVD